MKKRITSGPPIQLPESMKKISKSLSEHEKKPPILKICCAGVDPSGPCKTLAKLKSINGKEDSLCASEVKQGGPIKVLSEMYESILIGLGVPENLVMRYSRVESRTWDGVAHVHLRGVSDPTGKLPAGHIYITGICKELRNRLDKYDILLTRPPVLKTSQTMMIKVITKKPPNMSEDDYQFLESLAFGTVVFAFPSKGMLPIPEVIDGDLDGDRFFGMYRYTRRLPSYKYSAFLYENLITIIPLVFTASKCVGMKKY